MASRYAQKHFLYAEIEKMLRAGFGVDRAVRTLLKQEGLSPAQRDYLDSVVSGLEAGRSIAESVSGARGAARLTELEKTIVAAGERGGKLEQAYGHLSQYFAVLEETRREIRRAMIYPVLLLHVAVLLPAIPKAILMQGEVSYVELAIVPLLILYAAGVAAVIAGRIVIARARTSATQDAVLRRIPFVGKAREALAMGRFCQVFHMHLLAALPISESIRVAGEASQSGLIRDGATKVSEAVKAGSPLGAAVGREAKTAFPPDFAASINVAEEAGTLDEDLARWTKAYRESAVQALRAAGQWFPKVFYGLVVLVVGWQLISLGKSYFEVIEGFMGE